MQRIGILRGEYKNQSEAEQSFLAIHLITIQNHNLRLRLSYGLHTQYIPNIDLADERSVPPLNTTSSRPSILTFDEPPFVIGKCT